MDNLWKKDTGKTGHGYVDLFTPLMCLNASLNELDSIEKLMHSMELGELPQIQKDNQQSTEWRLKGNTLFGQQKWEEAAICYNKSLCFAEVGTENVALAYSNRSACLFRVHMYNEVLIDIDLAIRAKLPAHLLPKLEQRKKDTLKLMSIIKRKEESKPKLSYIADKNFPCMANVVDIKYNEEFGRHLAAKQDIPADKVVLVEDILRVADNPWECHSCSKICMNCIACPNCPDIMFCGVDCINKCKTHNFECGTFFPNLQVSDRFLIKSLLFAITTFPNVDSLMQFVEAALLERPETLPTSMRDPESKYHFFFKLSTSAPYPLGSTVANMAYMYVNNLPKVSCLFDTHDKKLFLMHLTMHHALICRTNAFGDEDLMYMANVTSLLNHACASNLDLVFSKGSSKSMSKRQLIGMTSRPIEKGNQLFINYEKTSEKRLGELSAAKRNEILKSERGFVCKCEICEPIIQ